MGGSSHRMESFASLVQQELNLPVPVGTTLCNISSTDRYALYKAGPILSVSVSIISFADIPLCLKNFPVLHVRSI